MNVMSLLGISVCCAQCKISLFQCKNGKSLYTRRKEVALFFDFEVYEIVLQ